MHRSVGKITVLLFSSQTKFAPQKAAIIQFSAEDHVISLSCGREKSLHTKPFVPISHVETLLLFYFLIYVMNRTVIFQTY